MSTSSPSTAARFNGEGKQTKYLIVTGGTVSGLGKGTAISSLGVVLKSHGLHVTAMKIDPYLNVDAGTMSPFEHGEVFVLDDGGEADLDLGNYERFLDLTLESVHSLTTGKIYQKVLKRERAGDFLGKTVQMVPHVTDEIQDWIQEVASMPTDKSGEKPDVCLIELGGTVGDIESAVYLEALQQFQFKMGAENFLSVHLGWVPYQNATGEQKTKPCQHSVKVMREAGLKPDLLICRSKEAILPDIRKKLSLFCQVKAEEVVSLHDVSNIFRVPLLLAEQNVGTLICKKLGLTDRTEIKQAVLGGVNYNGGDDPLITRLGDWAGLAGRVDQLSTPLRIGMVGKYTGLTDSYMSVVKSLQHACIEAGVLLDLQWIESTNLELNTCNSDPKKYEESWAILKSCKGILVPGAFGNRGIEGKILAAKYCRENQIPYFGICVGLQVATIEFCRNVLGLEGANSTEFDESTPHPVVMFMPEHSATIMGGTMRLGARCTIIKDQTSLASKIYCGEPVVFERHRHRYEVNTQYKQALENAGFVFSGQDERGVRMEICELKGHPYYCGVQFHPEFKSRQHRPAATFLAFILASCGEGRLEQRIAAGGGKLKIGAGFAEEVVVSEVAASSSNTASKGTKQRHGKKPRSEGSAAAETPEDADSPDADSKKPVSLASKGSASDGDKSKKTPYLPLPRHVGSPDRLQRDNSGKYEMQVEGPASFRNPHFSGGLTTPDSPAWEGRKTSSKGTVDGGEDGKAK
ncbi:unnamed protein product [Amoebophrya sp. A25]|nr:unnamed protein product [Amoebophrya sp. A25]|eukprot:GSA25T00006839001.1